MQNLKRKLDADTISSAAKKIKLKSGSKPTSFACNQRKPLQTLSGNSHYPIHTAARSRKHHCEKENTPPFNFKARPMPQYPPPPAQTSNPSFTVPFSPLFRSKSRAKQRAEFDRKVMEAQTLAEAEKLKSEAMAQELEAKEIQDYRKTLVFKARPMPEYRECIPPKTERPLTLPVPVKFLTEQRAQVKSLKNLCKNNSV
mmetsp:Transcript_6946/g.10229  ORF Transcript_6946/g.10229 Transcript_6946/m.10229 type:complete len:199 (+) Transcript_6946:1348-1944(+)